MSELNVSGTATINERPASRAIRKLAGGFRRFSRQANLRGLAKSFGGLAASMRGVIGLGGPLAGLFGAGGLVVAGNFTKKWAEGTDELSKFSREIGFTVQSFRELSFVADRQGVSQSTLNSSMTAFSKRLGEAKQGTGALAGFLKKSNPELLKQIKGAKSSEEAFGLMIGALSKIEDPADRAALAAAAFSRSGIKMGRIAEAGADGIAKLRAEARKYLGVLTQADGAESEKFVDSTANLAASMKGLGDAIGSRLLPVIRPYIDAMTEWVTQNRELIATNVTSAVRKLAEALAAVDWVGVGKSISGFAASFDSFAQSVGGYENLFLGIGAVIGASFLAPVLSVLLSLGQVGVALLGLGAKATKGVGAIKGAFKGLKLSSFFKPLKIATLVVGLLNWNEFVKSLNWKDFVSALLWTASLIPGIGWVALAGALSWDLLLSKLPWEKYFNMEKIKGLIDTVRGWLKSLWGGLKGLVGLGSGNTNNGPSKPSRPGSRGGTTPPGRVFGGKVFKGLAYTVGEAGREAFLPQQNGTILNNRVLEALLSRQNGIPSGFSDRLMQAVQNQASLPPSQSTLDINFANAPGGTNATFKQKGRRAFSKTSFSFRNVMGFGGQPA